MRRKVNVEPRSETVFPARMMFGCFYLSSAPSAEEDCAVSAISGFVASAVLENARHSWTMLQSERDAESASGLQLLLREWLAGGCEDGKARIVRYRGQIREIFRLAEVPGRAPGGNEMFRHKGHYLVVGGSGPVGKLLCRELAIEFQARISILARSPDDAATAAQCNTLRQLGATDAYYHSVDIIQEADLSHAIDSCVKRNGAIHGVIHLARLVDDGLIVDKIWPAFLRSTAAKVQGTVNLDQATADQPLAFFALFSSMGAYGIRGSADYGYAAAFQNAYVGRRRALEAKRLRNGASISFCWGAWNVDRYMPADRDRHLRDLGLDQIDMKSAFTILRQSPPAGVMGALAVADKALTCRRLSIAPMVAPAITRSDAGPPSNRGAERLEAHLEDWKRQRRQGVPLDPGIWTRVLADYDIDALDDALVDRLEEVLFAPGSDWTAATMDGKARPREERAHETDEMMQQICDIVSHILLVEHPDVDEPLQRYGLDSVGAMQVASALSRKFGHIVEPKQLLQRRSVRLIAEYLAASATETVA